VTMTVPTPPPVLRAADNPQEPVEGEVLPPAPLVDPHALLAEQRDGFVVYSCRCGEWEAVATGPSSALWTVRDHDRHRREP
jgi:hypothetical protein